MQHENKSIDLTSLGQNSNIPSIYYGASNHLITKIDPFAGKLMARAVMPGGTAIAMTINLIKDPNNKGKVIASTVLSSGIMYRFVGPLVEQVIVRLIFGVAGIAVGAASVPIGITIVSAIGIAVIGTYAGSFIYDFIYKKLETFEEFTSDLEIDIFSQDIVGKISQEEFILNSLKNNTNFCKENFPLYVNYRKKVTIGSGNSNISSLTEYFGNNPTNEIDYDVVENYIKNNSDETVAEIKVKDLNEAKILTNTLILNADKLRKNDVTVITTEDNQEYTIMLGSSIDKIAQKNNISRKELLDNNEWIENENRIK